MMSDTSLERKLRAAGERLTPQRRLIASILQEQDGHLSATDIYFLARREHPQVSLATVYRTLRRLKESGLVRELQLPGGQSHYEVAQGQAHQHLVCLGCGKVIEFTCNYCSKAQERLAKEFDFEIQSVRVKLLGYCAECRARQDKDERKHNMRR